MLHIRAADNGKRLVVVATRQISIFDFTPPKQEAVDFPMAEISSAALSADGIHLAIGNYEGTIVVMNLREKKWSAPMTDPKLKKAVISLAFHPTEPVLAASYNIDPVDGFEQPIVLWDVIKESRLDPPFVGHRFEVTSLSFSPDGKQLASGSWDGNVSLWDFDTRQLILPVLVWMATGSERITDRYAQVAIRPDGEMLVSVMPPIKISLWDMTSHKILGNFVGLIKGTTLAFSPKDKRAAIGGEDKNILLIPTDFKYWLQEACRLTRRSLSDQEKRYYIGETGSRLILAGDPCVDIK